MAISLLQDAQTRSLAAALAGIKRDEVDHSLSMSPPMSANSSTSALYPGLQHAAAASAFGMLSPTQLLAANRQAAAAFMAAQLPMSTLASTLFPHHPALFGSWAAAANTTPHMPLSSGPHSPPASPHSPVSNTNATVTTPATGKYNVNVLSSPTTSSHHLHHHHNHGQTSPTGEAPPKKARKLSVKKDLISPTLEMSPMNDLYSTPGGPISPPSSGSSPNSTHDGPVSGGNHKDASRDKSFTCKICSRSFGYKHVLQNHERTHTGEKPFECPECHKRFTRDHHLKTHMRLHTGEKPYHCSHCDRQFVQVANLRRHLRVHTGEKPYTCDICDGKFSDSNQLKSHMLVHNGEKPFECERCHMKFRRRHHLMNHKCGIQSPPTPAISPAMSGDYPICDQKSALGSSYGSEESMDLGKTSTTSSSLMLSTGSVMTSSYESEQMDAPLDLSEDNGSSSIDENNGRSKNKNMRRPFRLPMQIMHVPTAMPEQTEPEDLSMHSPRSATSSNAATAITNSQENLHLQHAHNFNQHSHPHTHLMSSSTESMLHAAADDEDDVDLDELDDAATLYMRQQQMKRNLKME